MRLIDADELLKGRTDHEMISTHLIFNAPTVDVLDKIRAEIEDCIRHSRYFTTTKACCGVRDEVLRVIDKYKAERTDG